MDSPLRDLLDIALACGISHMTTTWRSSKDWQKQSAALKVPFCPAMRLKIMTIFSFPSKKYQERSWKDFIRIWATA
jgi:hypothetical protein